MLLITVLILSILQIHSASAPLVKVEFYAMSKCIDAIDLENKFNEYVLELAPIINLSIEFIATVNESERTGFSSSHGESEVYGDLYEICAQTIHPEIPKWYHFLSCMNKEWRDIPQFASSCAHSSKMNWNQLGACASGVMGKRLLTESIEKTKNIGAKWSPSIYINGELYCKWRSTPCKGKSIVDLKNAICAAYTGSNIPTVCRK